MTPDDLNQLQAYCCDAAAFEALKRVLAVATQQEAEQHRALLRVIAKIRESLDLDTIFKATATEVRKLLNADRVGVFRFYPDSGYNDGEFVSEEVLPGFSSALAAKIHDHCFGERYAMHYEKGKIQAVADIFDAGLQACHVEVLAQFQIRANLIVPLLQGDRLWGLLCIHQCANPREWQAAEIEFVTQIATQLEIALQQAELFATTQQQAIELAQTLQKLQKTQTQLIQNEKMTSLGQLVAGVAHEINNPVNFIYGNLKYASQYANDLLELLNRYQHYYPNPDPGLQEFLDSVDLDFLAEDLPKTLSSMQMGADRIRQIVLSLRNFSRLDEAEMKPVDIHEGLESTLLILQYRLKQRTSAIGIEILKNYGELPLVECYPSQLNQVFMNILSNAIDALEQEIEANHGQLEERPTITIQTALKEDENSPSVVIHIADNGGGIPEAIQSKLFDPFFTTKPAGKGTGLGLSISYQIVVDRHRGSLSCISHPGQGTSFFIEIPVEQSQRSPHKTAAIPSSEVV